MQIAIVVVLVVLSIAILGRQMLAKTGIGRPNGKPDCGCGHCNDEPVSRKQ